MYKMEGIGTVFTRQHQNNILIAANNILHNWLLGVWLNCIHYYILSLVQRFFFFFCKKVQVGNNQEKAQSEKRFPLQKPRQEKQTNNKVLRP